jgi:hypothetical protein
MHNQWRVDNFLPQKQLKSQRGLLSVLYQSKSYFLTKADIAFGLFSWLLAFAKAKAGLKV